MESELERLSKSNDEEKLKNEELRTKLNASAVALQQEKQVKRDAELALKRIKTDIHNCSALITEPKLLTQRVAEIYAQYVRDDAVRLDDERTNERRDEFRRVFRPKKRRSIKTSRKNTLGNAIISNERFAV